MKIEFPSILSTHSWTDTLLSDSHSLFSPMHQFALKNRSSRIGWLWNWIHYQSWQAINLCIFKTLSNEALLETFGAVLSLDTVTFGTWEPHFFKHPCYLKISISKGYGFFDASQHIWYINLYTLILYPRTIYWVLELSSLIQIAFFDQNASAREQHSSQHNNVGSNHSAETCRYWNSKENDLRESVGCSDSRIWCAVRQTDQRTGTSTNSNTGTIESRYCAQ